MFIILVVIAMCLYVFNIVAYTLESPFLVIFSFILSSIYMVYLCISYNNEVAYWNFLAGSIVVLAFYMTYKMCTGTGERLRAMAQHAREYQKN